MKALGQFEIWLASLQECVSSSALDMRGRLLAVFDWLGEFYLTEGPGSPSPARQM
jgi:hypothetical protein